jgi:DNA (cytosine-5)-methyltransferase 1
MSLKKQYKLLDLFCGGGGAAQGYIEAGFDVTGIDCYKHKHYPGKFIQAPALWYLRHHGHLFDAIHASPPCQHASKSTSIAKSKGKSYPDFIPRSRHFLARFSCPTIMENVPGAKIRPDLLLYGTMFNLLVLRKRIFEINNCFILQAGIPPKNGSVRGGDYYSIFGKGSWKKSKTDLYPKHRLKTVRESWANAMGIKTKMNERELAEAIPPAYTYYIGKQIINYLDYELQQKRKREIPADLGKC